MSDVLTVEGMRKAIEKMKDDERRARTAKPVPFYAPKWALDAWEEQYGYRPSGWEETPKLVEEK
jgi:hypothetical protein